jgi:acyl carrier protein
MATSQPDIAGSIETFIRREFRIIDGSRPFSRDDHLFESGYVDSAGVVELIMFIESAFGVKLEDEHVFSEQFTTVNGITSIVLTCETQPDELRSAFR